MKSLWLSLMSINFGASAANETLYFLANSSHSHSIATINAIAFACAYFYYRNEK